MSLLAKFPSYAETLISSMPVQFWYFAAGYILLKITRWVYGKVAR